MSTLTAVSRVSDVCDLAPGYIRSIAPYQPGKPISELARELGLDPNGIIKLASNENPLGVSPLAMQAMQEALADVARYPDGNGFELKQALSQRYGVDMAQIVLGNGSNDVLELAARCISCTRTRSDLLAACVRGISARDAGSRGHRRRSAGARFRARSRRDAEGGHAAHAAHFLANPNNPTGTLIRSADLHAFLRALPPA